MKKAGLITIHNAYNYGAVLQSTALLSVVESLGISCELIDYICEFEEREKKLFVKDFSLYGIMRNIRSMLSYSKYKKRSNAFEGFMKENYCLSSISYKDYDDFLQGDFNYDYCITGSDQTFCLHLRGDDVSMMKPYFLEYVQKGKKVSYASSFGEKIKLNTADDEKWIKDKLKGYHCLSVREKRSADYTESLIGERPSVVLDPTLLLNEKEWSKFEKPIKIKGDYILFYSVLSDKSVVKAVHQFAKKIGLKVVVPHLKNHYEIFEKFVRVDYVGPGEFLSLIKNAKYIVTTSFHGTVFALNYKKPFSSMLLGEGNRISSILHILQLQNRLAKNADDLFAQYSTVINYQNPHELLEEERKQSIDFLKNALDYKGE